MLRFTCPRCGTGVQVDPRWAGKQVQCGACKNLVVAPSLVTRAEAPTWTPLPGSLRPATRVPEPPPGNRQGTPPPALSLAGILAPPQHPDELGRLGPYVVREVLGHGGMGIVLRADDPQLHRTVALKVLRPELASDPTNRQRFLREAQAAAALEHDHVVTLYQVGEDRGIPYLAMQLLQGETLEQRLRREQGLPVPEVLRIAREIALALSAAHARGLVHRDVKPANIWLEARDPGGNHGTPPLGQGGRVKLLDFGLARVATPEAGLTQSGVLLGTPGYVAPEQVRGGPPDPRSDLFSLGCVLYRLCTGRFPFTGTDTLALLASLSMDNPQPIQEVNPAVPKGLADLVMGLLVKDPARRIPTARAVLAALDVLEGRVQAVPGQLPAANSEPDFVMEVDGIQGRPSAGATPRPSDETLLEALPVLGGLARLRASSRRLIRLLRDRPLLLGCGALAALLSACVLVAGIWWAAARSGTRETPEQAKGGPGTAPAVLSSWVVLFRSDDPSVWNTQSEGNHYAIPLLKAPQSIRYIRLRRLNTNEAMILPLTRGLLEKDDTPPVDAGYAWVGGNKSSWNTGHLGIAQAPVLKGQEGKNAVILVERGFDAFAGSGFGHNLSQIPFNTCGWRGKPIPRTTFEIAVVDRELTPEERKDLLPVRQ